MIAVVQEGGRTYIDRVVWIEWIDANEEVGWVPKGAVDNVGLLVKSIGFVVKEDRHCITITNSDTGRSVNDPFTIPKACIRGIWEVTF